ncbi:activator protein [Actinomadura craniellae]|uniref:Activator protein n=1 Tax=Actinomadura craniellae TaxID=2231787 RepID=A0A365GYM1_9ACTN|nr:AfsR/SARP family transcriptional regulator [Actinomadura craniellae]RAY11929.1 activator protein [Actinomadura craniellae]
MRYEVLGPLRIVDEHGGSFISGRKIETVLAVLLVRAGGVVTFDQLMAEIWGDTPPRRASAAIYVYISQLRKHLKRPGRSSSEIITRAPGYVLQLGSDELDANSFIRLVNTGREHSREGRHREASRCFQSALDLWHGPVLGDLRGGGSIIEGFATWLEEVRLECTEMLMDSYLQLGDHRRLVGQLYSLASEYPLNEAFYRQLMLALYRSERQADALEVYQSARKVLKSQLGLDPCRGLQDLQRAILLADDQLETTG